MTFVNWMLTETFVGPVALIVGGSILAWSSARSFFRASEPEIDPDTPGEPDDLDWDYAQLVARQHDLDRVEHINGSAPYKAWLREQIEAGCTFDSLFHPDRGERGAQ